MPSSFPFTESFEPVFTVGGQLFVKGHPTRPSAGIISLTQVSQMLQERSEDLLTSLETIGMLMSKDVEDGLMTDGELENVSDGYRLKVAQEKAKR